MLAHAGALRCCLRGMLAAGGDSEAREWPARGGKECGLWIMAAVLAALVCRGLQFLPLPESVGRAWLSVPPKRVRFLADVTWYDAEGERHIDQTIFDEILR
ncbi:hypothetical protein DSL92_08360 [Billgrantia gudaonensis]|uniref:Uncharacterized protein n=1 Tax=Billgrantia gudaonensis TaxID=376427 RepID=A0A432JHT3_9GAMM|nr:hypothetical protein DSL92_08360 [Halomonas gudaonensis]